MNDQRYVYSAGCTWHGPIQEVASSAPADLRLTFGDGKTRNVKEVGGLPCCPHCGSMLMEYPTSMEWRAAASKFCAINLFSYGTYMKWLESLRVDDEGKPVKCEPLKDWDWRQSYADFCAEKRLPA